MLLLTIRLFQSINIHTSSELEILGQVSSLVLYIVGFSGFFRKSSWKYIINVLEIFSLSLIKDNYLKCFLGKAHKINSTKSC